MRRRLTLFERLFALMVFNSIFMPILFHPPLYKMIESLSTLPGLGDRIKWKWLAAVKILTAYSGCHKYVPFAGFANKRNGSM
jgi:hypothetical protein